MNKYQSEKGKKIQAITDAMYYEGESMEEVNKGLANMIRNKCDAGIIRRKAQKAEIVAEIDCLFHELKELIK